jgi:outer membrane cobalamin receptor
MPRRELTACILALRLFCPLAAEDAEDGFFDDDSLIMEDETGLTVVGAQTTTQDMKIVTKEEIERIQAPDLAALLQETLNIGVTRYGGYGNGAAVNMRGFDSERIAFLINGIPANSARSGDFDIDRIDLNSIERIEVIYGGSDSKYNVSGSMGGVINIITVKNQKPGLHLGASLSNTSSMPGEYTLPDGGGGNPEWGDLVDAQKAGFSAAYGSEKYSVNTNIFANRAANHFLYTDYMKKTRRKIHNETLDAGTSVSFIQNFENLSKLILSGGFYYADKNSPDGGAETYGTQQDFNTRQNIMLDMPRAFRDDMALEVSLSHNWETLDYRPPSGASSLHDEHATGMINRWRWDINPQFTMRAGWDYRYSTLDSTDMKRHEQSDGGLYVTGELKIGGKFLVVPSIKAVFNSNGASPVVPVPKLGAAYFVTQNLTIRNNYFRSFKYPSLQSLYWPDQGDYAGNPNLKPEDVWGSDLGASWRYKIFSLDASAFAQYTYDSIHWAASGTVWRPSNVGKAAMFGFDGRASVDIPLSKGPFKKIIPALSYKGMLSRLLSYGFDFSDEKRVPYTPAHSIMFSVDLPWESGALLISAGYESARYSDTQNTEAGMLKPLLLVNVNVNQRINSNFTAFGEIRNLLNTSYESFAGYPMPGISVTLGVRMNFESIGERR